MRDFFRSLIAEILKQLRSNEPSLSQFFDGTLLDWTTPFLDSILFPEVYLFSASSLIWKMIFSFLIAFIFFILVVTIERIVEKKSGKKVVVENNKILLWIILLPLCFYGGKGLIYGYLFIKPML